MLGRRGPQRGLFEADALYGELVGRDTFYGWLVAQRDELFRTFSRLLKLELAGESEGMTGKVTLAPPRVG